jgi:hypothetical protein
MFIPQPRFFTTTALKHIPQPRFLITTAVKHIPQSRKLDDNPEIHSERIKVAFEQLVKFDTHANNERVFDVPRIVQLSFLKATSLYNRSIQFADAKFDYKNILDLQYAGFQHLASDLYTRTNASADYYDLNIVNRLYYSGLETQASHLYYNTVRYASFDVSLGDDPCITFQSERAALPFLF